MDMKKIRVGYTLNCGNYQSVRLDVEFERNEEFVNHIGDDDAAIAKVANYCFNQCLKLNPEYMKAERTLEETERELASVERDLAKARGVIAGIQRIAASGMVVEGLQMLAKYSENFEEAYNSDEEEDSQEEDNKGEDNENSDYMSNSEYAYSQGAASAASYYE